MVARPYWTWRDCLIIASITVATSVFAIVQVPG